MVTLFYQYIYYFFQIRLSWLHYYLNCNVMICWYSMFTSNFFNLAEKESIYDYTGKPRRGINKKKLSITWNWKLIYNYIPMPFTKPIFPEISGEEVEQAKSPVTEVTCVEHRSSPWARHIEWTLIKLINNKFVDKLLDLHCNACICRRTFNICGTLFWPVDKF